MCTPTCLCDPCGLYDSCYRLGNRCRGRSRQRGHYGSYIDAVYCKERAWCRHLAPCADVFLSLPGSRFLRRVWLWDAISCSWLVEVRPHLQTTRTVLHAASLIYLRRVCHFLIYSLHTPLSCAGLGSRRPSIASLCSLRLKEGSP